MAEKKIGGREYRTEPLTAREAVALYTDIMRVGSLAAEKLPAIIVAFGNPDTQTGDAMADVAALAAIGDILRKTSTDVVMELLDRILGAAQIRQDSGTYLKCEVDHFSGDLGTMFPVVKFVLQVQYADFFTGSAGNGILNLLQEVLQNRKSGA